VVVYYHYLHRASVDLPNRRGAVIDSYQKIRVSGKEVDKVVVEPVSGSPVGKNGNHPCTRFPQHLVEDGTSRYAVHIVVSEDQNHQNPFLLSDSFHYPLGSLFQIGDKGVGNQILKLEIEGISGILKPPVDEELCQKVSEPPDEIPLRFYLIAQEIPLSTGDTSKADTRMRTPEHIWRILKSSESDP